MNNLKQILRGGIAVGSLFILVACGDDPKPQQPARAPHEETVSVAPDPAQPAATVTPIVGDVSCQARPTNDEIISETHKCESAGLTAMALHCGEDSTIVQIQCTPTTKE